MKIGILTPTRGDRPLFVDQYNEIIKSQTLQPDEIIKVDYKPVSQKKDLGARYRIGIQEAQEKKCDILFLWEDDDWYHPNYLQWMYNKWLEYDKPDVLGVNETYYYHIIENRLRHLKHDGRSSAFCTLLKLPYKYSFTQDEDIFFDLHLYKTHAKKYLKSKTISFDNEIYAIGIKHGYGVSGGAGHNPKFKWEFSKSQSQNWLNKHCMDSEVYKDIALKINNENKRRHRI
tara:strand:- start:262 stop:951 length:690 start_codon:yes stop_codon:yes gene_type:complete